MELSLRLETKALQQTGDNKRSTLQVLGVTGAWHTDTGRGTPVPSQATATCARWPHGPRGAHAWQVQDSIRPWPQGFCEATKSVAFRDSKPSMGSSPSLSRRLICTSPFSKTHAARLA